MAQDSESNRWWENYLVRYFLPSVAGMLIVLWLVRFSAADRYIPAFLPGDWKDLPFQWKDIGTAHLVLWLLFGSLYCYVASYPALVFHATRVLDFENVKGQFLRGRWLILNPYILTALFGIAVWICASFNAKYFAIIVVSVFVALQVVRIWQAMTTCGPYDLDRKFGAEFDASIGYAYLRTLSDRRATTSRQTTAPESYEAAPTGNRSGENLGETTTKYGKDLVDSYRHLREHGNTAFIIFLEITLCPVLYLILGKQSGQPDDYLFLIVIAIWIFPSVLVHGFAQHLEHRFSWFERSIRESEQSPEPVSTTWVTGQSVPPLSTTWVTEQSGGTESDRKT